MESTLITSGGSPSTRSPHRSTTARTIVLTLYGAALAAVTLMPAPWAEAKAAQISYGVLSPTAWLSIRTWASGSPPEFVLNVVLFLPLGILLAHRGTRRASTIAASLTLAIEIAQIPITGRISDPRDLIANISGALLGVAIARWIRRVRLRTRQHL